MSKITVCLTNWARPDNLENIIDLVSSQNIETTIFLWNNGEPFTHPKIDWLVNSSINKVCGPRWYMAANAATEFVCILDDDVFFTDDCILSDMLSIAENVQENTILGPAGVKLVEGETYKNSKHLNSSKGETTVDTKCDIIKGSTMFLRTKCLKEKVNLGLFDYYREEDIVVSGLLANGKTNNHVCLTSFGERFVSLGNDEFALWRIDGHYEARDNTCRTFFPEFYNASKPIRNTL